MLYKFGYTETVNVNFSCNNGLTRLGTSVYIVGNVPALGNWAIVSVKQKLEPMNYPTWTDSETMRLPKNTVVQWKCVKADENSWVISEWQGGPDNVFNIGADDGATGASF